MPQSPAMRVRSPTSPPAALAVPALARSGNTPRSPRGGLMGMTTPESPPRSAAGSVAGGGAPRSAGGASPRGARLPHEKLRFLERQGQRCFASGDFASAASHTTRCVKALQSHLASLLSLRSAISLAQREYATAMADADSAIQLNRGWYKGYLRKGAVLLAMNAPMEAAEVLETALQMSATTPGGGNAEVKRTLREAYKAIANGCYEQGHYDFAVRWNDHAVEILRSEGTLAEEELGQQCALCFANRSSANLRQKNVREALRDAELACFNNPSWAKGWLRKGLALAALGGVADLENARDAFEEGLVLEPKSSEVKRKLAEVRRRIQAASAVAPEEAFNTSYSDLLVHSGGSVGMGDDDIMADDVPHFHSEWARYFNTLPSERRSMQPEQIKLGVELLYDAYLQARNIRLHLFSLQTYEWSGELDAVKHRVGNSDKGVEWYNKLRREKHKRLGAVRQLGGDEAPRPDKIMLNRSFVHYPPPKLTLQVHGTVSCVAFHFIDLMVLLMSTIVYADGSSVLNFVGYDSSPYVIAKSAVLAQMLLMDAPLGNIIQVWFSSGWSHETEANFRLACNALVKAGADPASLSGTERQEAAISTQLPHRAKVVVQIWSGTASIDRADSLIRWRKGHNKNNNHLGFLAANLRECRDRIDYCHYFLNGEIMLCEVGSITMYAEYSDVQRMVASESILQAIPILPLETAYDRPGTLFPTIVSMLKRRLHVTRLRLRKRRLRFEFHMSPLPSDPGIGLSDPNVARGLDEVQQHQARYFYWGNLPDALGSTTLHDLIEKCGAMYARNFATSLRWGDSTFGTHLIDYERAERVDLLQSLWAEAQHGVQASAAKILRSSVLDNPFHLCQWGLARRYQRSWANNFFEPEAVVHRTETADFSPFTLFPLMLEWTPKPAPDPVASPGPVRSASPNAALAPGDLGGGRKTHDGEHRHTTTIHCHVCNKTVTLDERGEHHHSHAHAAMARRESAADIGADASLAGGPPLGPERMGMMISVFDAMDNAGGQGTAAP